MASGVAVVRLYVADRVLGSFRHRTVAIGGDGLRPVTYK